MKKDAPKSKNLELVNTPVFALKDKPNRQFQIVNLKNQFGFIPEVIIIQKVIGQNNRMVISAVKSDEQLEKEKKLLKKTISSKQ